MWHLHFKVIFILYSRERKKLAEKVNRHIFEPRRGRASLRSCVFVCACVRKRTEMSWFIETVNEKLVKFSSTHKLSSHFFPLFLSLLQCASICVHSPLRAALMTTEQHKPAVHHNAVSLSYTPLLIFAFHYHALILPLSLHLLSLLSYVTVPF